MRRAFSELHPVVNFIWFFVLIVCSMILMQPVCLAISFVSALVLSYYFCGKRILKFQLFGLFPLMLLAAILNPAFNHQGVTILCYFPTGNPLTLESLCFGVSAAMMLGSVVCWFSCYHAVMTTDKLVYLFGRILPSFSLILSMIFRFVPRLSAQLKKVRAAQKSMGRDGTNGTLRQKLSAGMAILSAMTSWMLEYSMITADSMKSRGYGLKGRTAYSVYQWSMRDLVMLILILVLGLYVVLGMVLGSLSFSYFPYLGTVSASPYSVTLYLCYFLLAVMPLLLDRKEAYTWTAIKSKI